MLTRLEVDGFKNLLNFAVDFGPFTCIAGVNGVGKSNIFDAIRFLSLLTDHTLIEASLLLRESDEESADPRDLFWRGENFYPQSKQQLTIAAEMIVNPNVEDDFGRPAQATSTYLRYEVKIGYEPPEYRGTLGRLVLLHEKLAYFTKGDAGKKLLFPHSARYFRDDIVDNARRGSDFISTHIAPDGQIEIHIHQDGGSSGKPQKAPAAKAPRTIVGTSNTSTTPTILAARREMQSWKFLALEPRAMRGADRFNTESQLTAAGDHLPATLHRLATQGNEGISAEQIYSQIAGRLAELVPVRDVRVDVEETRQLLTLEVQEHSGLWLPARALSDGTLRFLTLAVLAEDPEFHGLLCMEEPENGIHPDKMSAMVSLLKDIAVDTDRAPGDDNPLRQVIVATHSPALVQLLDKDDLLLAEPASIRRSDRSTARTLRALPLEGSWRCDNTTTCVGKMAIVAYLTAPEGATLQLPLDLVPRRY